MTYDPPPSSPYGPANPYGADPSQPWQQPAQPQYGQPEYGQPPQSPYGPPADSPYSAPPVPSPGPSYPPPAYPTSGPGYQQPTSGPGYPQPTSGPGYQQPGYPPAPAPQPPKKSNTGVIIALVAVILVVVCGGVIGVIAVLANKSKPDAGPTHAPTARSTTGAPAPTNTGGGGVSGSGTVPFGADHGVKWNDNIEASVLSVQKFTPSSTAAGTHSGQVGIKVTVKITNNSGKQLDLTLAEVKLKSGDNGTQADDIIDIENNITLGFEGAVASGHSATAVYAFSVPPADLTKLDIEVTPGWDYDAGIFEGSAS